jgi:hypothetical protein
MRSEDSIAAGNSGLLGYLHGRQCKISQHLVETLHLHLQGLVSPKRMTYKLSPEMSGHVKLSATQCNIPESSHRLTEGRNKICGLHFPSPVTFSA